MNGFTKFAVALATVYLFGLLSLGALLFSVVAYNEKTQAMSATIESAPIVMRASSVERDELSIVGHTTIRFGDCMADNASGDLYETENPYCLVGESGASVVSVKVKTHGSNVPNVPSTSTPPVVNHNNPPTVNPSIPVDNTPHKKDKKVKQACNNGEGNGAEGCSPANSDNANNDENDTTPRDDKSMKHKN